MQMSRRTQLKLIAVSLAFAAVAACGLVPPAGGESGPIQPLNAKADELRDQFNRDKGKIRLLFVVDPICATCLRNAADLDRDIVSKLPPSVPVYIVHVPAIGGREDLIPGVAQLVHNKSVRHYWNASGAFGYQLGKSLPLREKGKPVYAWDVWMIYGPDAEWKDRAPTPEYLMHHLPYVDDKPHVPWFNSEEFAAVAGKMLTQARTEAAQ